ncbi:MCP four helix bundle domain-containing protein [Clostridium sp. WILCCON 0269]|uniref:MCP four helix bundle domain-containing protein n=1 Tax=Candidatus Clostridium eludens TaxID=3381663 RepID=A0ABW8SQ60_9CLOT
MNFFKNIKARRIFGSFYVKVALLAIVVSLIGIILFKITYEKSIEMYNHRLQSIYMLDTIKDNSFHIENNLMKLIQLTDDSNKKDMEKEIQTIINMDEKYITSCENLSINNNERQTYEICKSDFKKYRTLIENELKLIEVKNFNEAYKQSTQIPVIDHTIMDDLDKLINTNYNEARKLLRHPFYIY